MAWSFQVGDRFYENAEDYAQAQQLSEGVMADRGEQLRLWKIAESRARSGNPESARVAANYRSRYGTTVDVFEKQVQDLYNKQQGLLGRSKTTQDVYNESLNEVSSQYQTRMKELNDPTALNAMYSRAALDAQRGLSSQYSAMGLSGSSAYSSGVASAMADLGVQKQTQLESRKNMALQLGQNLVSMRAQPLEQAYKEKLYGLQKQQLLDEEAYLQWQKDEAESNKTLQYIGLGLQAGGTVAGLAMGNPFAASRAVSNASKSRYVGPDYT